MKQKVGEVLGSIGRPLRHTEIKVVYAKTDEVLPPGSKGIVKARGPQVMKGYYKNPSATKQVLDEDGWLNTGDIGWIAPHHSVGRSRHSGGIVFLEGRAKDTIVLSTGENVEPSELEEAAMRSSLIQQIVVIGQVRLKPIRDQQRLGAIIVPNKEELLVRARNSSIVDSEAFELSKENKASLVYDELRKWTSECSFQIGPILVIDEPFTIDSTWINDSDHENQEGQSYSTVQRPNTKPLQVSSPVPLPTCLYFVVEVKIEQWEGSFLSYWQASSDYLTMGEIPWGSIRRNWNGIILIHTKVTIH
ncbi:hypothetical protein LguiB_013257 [Lonicera macranthoides]